MKRKLLYLLLLLSMILAVTACGQNTESNTENNTKSNMESDTKINTESDTESDTDESTTIENYTENTTGLFSNSEPYVTFGHVNLKLQTDFPEMDRLGASYTRGIMAYPHGYSLHDTDSSNYYHISIETLLYGTADLAALPLAISQEKADSLAVFSKDHLFSDESSEGMHDLTELSRTKEVKVGPYDTIYFEVDPTGEEVRFDSGLVQWDTKSIFGYSFMYEEQPICVSMTYDAHKDYEKEELQEYLHYVILSLTHYNGEGFFELNPDNNLNVYYNNSVGASTTDEQGEWVNTFTIFGFRGGSQAPSHQMNRGTTDRDFFYPREIGGEMLGESLLDETVTYDGILPLILQDQSLRSRIGFWEHTKPVPTIIHESDVTICGVQMKRYEVTVTTETTPLSEFFVAYTFIYDGIPYLWKMDSNTASLYEFTEQEAAYEMDLIRLQADTMIRTLRLGE